MSVILVDLVDDKRDIMVSNAWWRATLEALQPFRVLPDEQMERLQTCWLGQQLTKQEAEAVGNALITGPLSAIKWSDNVYPPTNYWSIPRSERLVDYAVDTYWPGWLRAFAAFCLTCRGFIVY